MKKNASYYMYRVGVTDAKYGEIKQLGWIQAEYKHMPFKPQCYGIFGMRQVVVFTISYEVL
jgi:hypothetical protein